MAKCAERVDAGRKKGLQPDPELILEDARSIREGLWRMAHYARDAAETLDTSIEDEDLDGWAEAVEVREVLERLQGLSLEVSEDWTPTRRGTLPNALVRPAGRRWSQRDVLRAGGALEDVIAPPPGKLFPETNDNLVAILLTYGTRPLGRRR
jgi:hypothetical protein